MRKAIKIFLILTLTLGIGIINSYSQVTFWTEDFENDLGKGYDGTGNLGNDADGKWYIDASTVGGMSNSADYLKVLDFSGDKMMQHNDGDGEVTWLTYSIDISSYINITASATIIDDGSFGLDADDHITCYYKVDAGSWTIFETNGNKYNDFNSTLTASTNTIASGTNLYIKIITNTDYGGETYKFDDIQVSGFMGCTAPSVEPSGISFNAITSSSTTVSWTGNGNGDMVLVVVKESGSALTAPSNGSTYTANTVFGLGTEIGTGNFVVYDADGTTQSAIITGLSSGITYDYYIYAYNSAGNCYYLLAYETGSQATDCTPPVTPPSGLTFSSVGSTSMNVSWTNGSGTNVLVVVKESGSVHSDPSTGIIYTANSSFSSGDELGTGNYVCYSGTGTSFVLTGLTGNTTYDVSVYTFDTSPNCYNLTEEYDSQLTLAFSTFYINDNSTLNDVYTTVIGSDSNSGGSSDPFATINAAISAASNGDVIYIDAGTYNNWKNITLSKELSFLGAGSDITIIDNLLAGASTYYFMYVIANNVTFKDITVQGYENNGTQTPGHSGQALTIGNSATGVLIEDVILSNNGASGGNPSISVLSNCSVTIRGGGGVCNTWHTAYTGGIEAYGNGITLNIDEYVMAYNFKTGSYDGGGILISNANGTTTVNVTNSYFYNNEASDGGAISQRGGVLNVTDCIIEGNLAGQSSTTIYGGGVRISGGTATFTRTRFINNTLGASGGTLKGAAVGVYSLSGAVTLMLDNCYFSGNTAVEGDDIYADKSFSNTVNITAVNTTFSSSSKSIYNKDANIQLTNCGNPTIQAGSPNSPAVVKNNTDSPTSIPSPLTPGIVSGDCSTGIILPIELVSFSGTCINSEIHLKWSTASELNNNYIIIERSKDAYIFSEIGFVDGNGTSSYIHNYLFNDKTPFTGISYYRLAQVDFNGNINYSNIIKVNNNCDHESDVESVFYSADANEIVVDFSDYQKDEVIFSLFDISGKQIMKERIEPLSYQDKISFKIATELSNSIYIVNISTLYGTFNRKLIIKK